MAAYHFHVWNQNLLPTQSNPDVPASCALKQPGFAKVGLSPMHPIVEDRLLAEWKQPSAIFRREPKLVRQPVNNIAEADFFAC